MQEARKVAPLESVVERLVPLVEQKLADRGHHDQHENDADDDDQAVAQRRMPERAEHRAEEALKICLASRNDVTGIGSLKLHFFGISHALTSTKRPGITLGAGYESGLQRLSAASNAPTQRPRGLMYWKLGPHCVTIPRRRRSDPTICLEAIRTENRFALFLELL